MSDMPQILCRLLGAVALLGVLANLACAPFRVKVDYDPDVDFTALRSYAWLARAEPSEANPFADNPLLRKRVREAVEQNLVSRGYVVASQGAADFQMTFHVTLEDRTVAYGPTGWSYGHSRHSYGYGGSSISSQSFQQGTLILDAVNADGTQLLWRGWVSGAVPTSDTDRERVALAVREILARFPPSPSSVD